MLCSHRHSQTTPDVSTKITFSSSHCPEFPHHSQHSLIIIIFQVASSLLVLVPAIIWADKLVHHPVHHAPAPHHPGPYGPTPAPHHAPAPHGYGYCDPKAPPKCAEGSDLPYCVLDKEYPAYDIAVKIGQFVT